MLSVYMVSLGCAKNQVDAEIMLGDLLQSGFMLAVDPYESDLIIVNTCGFIQAARDEAYSVIEDLLNVKNETGSKLVAVGCLAQRNAEDIQKKFPGVDAVWGFANYSELSENCLRLFKKQKNNQKLCQAPDVYEGDRLISTAPSFAYLRLADGCDNNCTYCAIPIIRGRMRSRNEGSILEEAKNIEQQGVKELVVIAQDTTVYGRDKNSSLHILLSKLLKEIQVPRIRLLYAHPAHLQEDVADLLLNEPRLCFYLDLPIQHISDKILLAMGRGYNKEKVYKWIEYFAKNKQMTLRTTLLTGFPGETEDDFLQLLKLVQENHFQHLGVFSYSLEKDTKAYDYKDQVPAQEAERRREILMQEQQKNALNWLNSRVGKVEEILIDKKEEKGYYSGRSLQEAPDADNLIFIKTKKLLPGKIVKAKITARNHFDLLAKLVD